MLCLLSQAMGQIQRMGPYVEVPRIRVDLKSAEGLSDHKNVRCLIFSAGAGQAMVHLKIREGFVDQGVNFTVYDDSKELVSTLIAPMSENGWAIYRVTLNRNLLEKCWFDIYRSSQSYRLLTKGLPIREQKNEEAQRKE